MTCPKLQPWHWQIGQLSGVYAARAKCLLLLALKFDFPGDLRGSEYLDTQPQPKHDPVETVSPPYSSLCFHRTGVRENTSVARHPDRIRATPRRQRVERPPGGPVGC